MMEEYSRNPSPKLLKDIQEAKKHIPQLQGQLFRATGATQVKQTHTHTHTLTQLTNCLHVLKYTVGYPGTLMHQQHPRCVCIILCSAFRDRSRQTLILILSEDYPFSVGSHSFVSVLQLILHTPLTESSVMLVNLTVCSLFTSCI